MNDGALGAHDSFHGAADKRIFGGRHDLDGHIVGHQVLLNQLAHKIEFDLRCGGEADFDFFETNLQQVGEHTQFARDIHRLNQRLVAVAQVGTQPDRGLGQHGVGPGAVGQTNGGKGGVLTAGILQHAGELLSGRKTSNPMKNGPLLVATGRVTCALCVRYRLRPKGISSSASANVFMAQY